MVKIVKIRVHEKKHHYYLIEFLYQDGKVEEVAIHEDILVKKSLRKDLEMTEEEVRDLLRQESQNGAYLAAIRYLGYRMRSTKEMEDYLKKKEFVPQIVKDTLKRLTEEKLLNDLSYAQSFVRTRMNSAPKGPAIIFNELRRRGIPNHVAIEALTEYPNDRQYQNAFHFAEKKLKSSHSTSHHDQVKKVAIQLAQKGFSRDLISDVMKALPEEYPDKEWEALVKQAEKAVRKYKDLDHKEKNYKLRAFLYRKGFSVSLIDKYLKDSSSFDA